MIIINQPKHLRIAAATAAWNFGNTIEGSLNSTAEQTWPDPEHAIIHAGSTGSAMQLLENHRQQVGAFASEPDEGIYDALNKGTSSPCSDSIGLLLANDGCAHNDVFANIVHAFENLTGCAQYCGLQYIRKEDTTQVLLHWASLPFEPNILRAGWVPPHPILYAYRECYQLTGGFVINYDIAADYFSVLQLFSPPHFQTVHLPEALVKMRVVGASKRSLKAIPRKSREDYDALHHSNFGFLSVTRVLSMKNFKKLDHYCGER